jgi:hypothetical protein
MRPGPSASDGLELFRFLQVTQTITVHHGGLGEVLTWMGGSGRRPTQDEVLTAR